MKKEYFEQKQFPVGAGEKFVEKRKELSLPAIEIKNKVLWVNPAFKEAPFKLQKGKQTKLGMFFTPRVFDSQLREYKNLVIMPESSEGRSGMIGSVIFRDKEGRLYRDVDIKGAGAFSKSVLVEEYMVDNSQHDRYRDKDDEARGLLDFGYALHDKEYSEKFLKAGIRTHRILGILGLKEVIGPAGSKVPVKDAKMTGRLTQKIEPVIAVRAFGTKERIDYVMFPKSERDQTQRHKAALQDAKMLVTQELGKNPDQFSNEQYLFWFAETLGVQIAKIRKLNLHHGYLSEHNITLDCRIVDLDSVTTVEEEIAEKKKTNHIIAETDLYEDDLERAKASLKSLVTATGAVWHSSEDIQEIIENIYKESYEKELQNKYDARKNFGA